MNKKLRDYQRDCINAIQSHFEGSDRQMIQLPTGAGKTFVFLTYVDRMRKKGSSCFLIVCPTVDLKEQIYEEALKFFHKTEIAKHLSERHRNLYIVTSSALNRWSFDKKFDLIVFDEAHRAAANTYKRFLKNYTKFHHAFKLLGVTATPERKDKKSLLEIFGDLTYEKNIIDLIEAKHLCDMKAFRINTKNEISSSDVRNGEFTPSAYKELDNKSRNELLIRTYVENCTNKKTLIFCLSIQHSEDISNELLRRGYKSQFIHGNLPYNERKKILSDFKSGKINVLTNCQLLTEGFDEPSIEALIIGRPTRSKALYVQMIGRALRIHPGKDFAELYELTDNAFKICTFDVAAGKEPEEAKEYKPGILLTERVKELVSLSNYKIEAVEIDLFEKVDLFKEYEILKSFPLHITGFLDSKLTYLEIAFIRWYEKLKVKYGFN